MKIETSCAQCGAALVRKQKMSRYFCNIECKSEWQRRANKPVSEEWLRDAYLVRKMDCTQIAALVGRDPKSIWTWLQNFGIETRKRGTTGNHVYGIGVPHILSEAGRKKLSEQAKAARAKDGRKPYLKDGKHWLHHDGAKPATWKGGISPERQAVYSSQEWKNAVKNVWVRDGFACVRCSKDLSHKNGECAIHHIEGFQNKDRRCDVSNLVLLCKQCHLWVHSRSNTEREFIHACN